MKFNIIYNIISYETGTIMEFLNFTKGYMHSASPAKRLWEFLLAKNVEASFQLPLPASGTRQICQYHCIHLTLSLRHRERDGCIDR